MTTLGLLLMVFIVGAAILGIVGALGKPYSSICTALAIVLLCVVEAIHSVGGQGSRVASYEAPGAPIVSAVRWVGFSPP
jgi:hypothetical protein